MNQVFKKLLENLKRANQSAKLRMAEMYGFKTVEEFEKFLTGDPASNPTSVPKTKTKKKGTIVGEVSTTPPILHNIHILDASTSMSGGKISSAISGINEEINALKAHQDSEYTTQTIVDFSSSGDIQTKSWKLPIKNQGYYHCVVRNSTALLEAIGVVLTRLLNEYKEGEKVLVKIFTDGQENDSASEWKYGVVPNLIKECESKGFVITFVGTESDVKYAVRTLNVKQSNTLVHDNTREGVAKSFKKSIGATVSYRAGASAGTDSMEDFYTDKK